MIAKDPRSITEGKRQQISFFYESGWLMIATVVGGMFMYAVHRIAGHMPKDEYGLFSALLQFAHQMSIPALGLQGIFVQQAAASLSQDHERELAGVFRTVLKATFCLWLLMAVLVFALRRSILVSFGIANPAALWVTILIALVTLWRPMVLGVMQGRQNFHWLGWTYIIDGLSRFLGIGAVVGLLSGYAAGAMLAVLCGSLIVTAIGFWFSRDCLYAPSKPTSWKTWLARVVPLTFGLGVGTFMLSADMLFVRRYLPKDQTGYYAAAAMVGRALVYFTAPLSAVMFPKLARSAALREPSRALFLALCLTAVAGLGAALLCSIAPWLPLRIVYDPSFLQASAPMVPWLAWCMLPLALANVLLNNLMARSQFDVVPWLICVAIGYALCLYFRHDSFNMVIQTLGVFGLILLAVCAWFSFRPSPRLTA